MIKTDNNCFHVHTYRCGHTDGALDEDYIKKAMELNFSAITFSDHAPFPGDLFGNRMKMEQLPEYVETLGRLKKNTKVK